MVAFDSCAKITIRKQCFQKQYGLGPGELSMAVPKQPFVSGPGVSTIYTGQNICQNLEYVSPTFVIPYIDPVLLKVSFRETLVPIMVAEEGGSELQTFVVNLWESVVSSFNSNPTPDLELFAVLNLNPGLNETPIGIDWHNLPFAHVSLSQVAGFIDHWWNLQDFGKYGFLNVKDVGFTNRMPVQFINSMENAFFNAGPVRGYRVLLQPECYGVLTAYGKLIPPPITWSGGGIASGSYPNDL